MTMTRVIAKDGLGLADGTPSCDDTVLLNGIELKPHAGLFLGTRKGTFVDRKFVFADACCKRKCSN